MGVLCCCRDRKDNLDKPRIEDTSHSLIAESTSYNAPVEKKTSVEKQLGMGNFDTFASKGEGIKESPIIE